MIPELIITEAIMIPVYIISEHSEAYYVWHRAKADGFMSQLPARLIHVDHHSDFDAGSYFHDFNEEINSPEQALKFMQHGIGIADFIAPAVWDGLFDEMVDFGGIFAHDYGWKQMELIRSSKGSSINLREYIPFVDAGAEADENRKHMGYRRLSLMKLEKPDNLEKPVVLDIDLDYFAWDNSLSTVKYPEIEITENAFREFNENYLHPMRILPKRIFYTYERDGHFFLQYREPFEGYKPVRDVRLLQRIENFMNWLRENEIHPALIDICRSNISGYCPSDRWMEIETLVLEKLGKLYELDIKGLLQGDGSFVCQQ